MQKHNKIFEKFNLKLKARKLIEQNGENHDKFALEYAFNSEKFSDRKVKIY